MQRKFLLTAVVVLLVAIFLVTYQGNRSDDDQNTPPSVEGQATQGNTGQSVSPGQDSNQESAVLPQLPAQTVEMELLYSYSGEQAMREILQLHRNNFPLLDGLVAIYGGEGAEGTVWVSVSPDVDEAADLMRLMIQELPTSPVFQEKDVFEAAGKDIYYVTGMGADHYYWHEDIYVYWLMVNSKNPQAELAAFLKN